MTDQIETRPPLVLTELEVKNFKRIKLVRVYPDGKPVVTVGGANAQGKTSLLDAIEALLGGGSSVPKTALRKGQKHGHVIGKLGATEDGGFEFEIERTFTPATDKNPNGGTALVIRNAEGVEVKAPQGVLNKMYSAISFDPLEFANADDQSAMLQRAMGCDFGALDAERAQAFTDRTVANRKLRDLEGQVRGLTRHPNVPAEEVTNAELMTKWEAATTLNATREALTREVRAADAACDQQAATVERLRAELAAAEAEFLVRMDRRDAAQVALAAAPAGDLDALKSAMATLDETNKKVRENKARDAKQLELDQAQERADELDQTIRDCDKKKAELLAGLNFPIPGLSFAAEGGVLLNGLPLSEAAESERIRLSVAIGFALNPRLRILLVRQGVYLDTKGRALLAELAAERGGQVWLEVVSEDGKGCSIVLEDGEVRA